jgi:long-chain acyl-CoA synthetase
MMSTFGTPTPGRHALLVRDFLELSARRLPEKVALVCDGQRLTYRQLDEMANRLANALKAFGVGRGDRVAIYMHNCVELVVGVFAILKAGGVFVIINATTKHDKLLYILNNCRASALLADPKADLTGLFETADNACPSLKGLILCGRGAEETCKGSRCISFEKALGSNPSTEPPCVNIDRDLACLIYTSGTTGDPKGVMSDHSNVTFAASSIIEYLGNVESDVVINVLPLSFDYGLYQLLMTFKFGGTLVLEKSFVFPAVVLKKIGQERVTGFPGVPTIYAMLIPMDLSAFDLTSLRYMSNTAAALPVAHIEEIRKKFPSVQLFSMYGLTETKRTLFLPPEMLDKKPGSVGIAIPGTETWLVDENGQRLPNGSTGQLVVRGRHVMRGYWEAPEATAARYRPGPLPNEHVCYSGDIFRTDEDGYFYFVSRKDDIIKSRGEKVAPKEVEAILYEIPGVTQAAVIGVPDPIQGQAIKALLVVQGREVTAAEVLAHCRARMEDYMMPKFVEFRESLPLTPSGKITKKDLT